MIDSDYEMSMRAALPPEPSRLPASPADRVDMVLALLNIPEELGGPLIGIEDARRLLESTP